MFTYAVKKHAVEDAVAYIDKDGDLALRTDGSLNDEGYGAAYISHSSPLVYHNHYNWHPEHPANKRLFFPGDEVTITF